MYNLIKYLPSKTVIITAVLVVGIFSRYIFGNNNLAEELSELIIKATTGEDVNFSVETPEVPEENLNRFIK